MKHVKKYGHFDGFYAESKDIKIVEKYIEKQLYLTNYDNFKKIEIIQDYQNPDLVLKIFFYHLNSKYTQLFIKINKFIKNPNPEYWELETSNNYLVFESRISFEVFDDLREDAQPYIDAKKYNL